MAQIENLWHTFFKSKVKVSLLLSFLFLIIYQLITGFNNFEDYVLALIFILFLNDQFLKIKNPEQISVDENEKKKRRLITVLILFLIILPSIFEFLHISTTVEAVLYKLGFILWAQVFLVDAFYHYKETNSKWWLLFANTAMFLIVFGAFII